MNLPSRACNGKLIRHLFIVFLTLGIYGCASPSDVEYVELSEVCVDRECGSPKEFTREELLGGLYLLLKTNELRVSVVA